MFLVKPKRVPASFDIFSLSWLLRHHPMFAFIYERVLLTTHMTGDVLCSV